MNATSQTCVIFRVGDEDFALPIGTVESIVRYETPTPVPHASPDVLGVVNLRGRIVPVIDLLHRFRSLRFSPGPFARIVVTESSEGPLGLAVDMAQEVAHIPMEDVLPVPESVLSTLTGRAFSGVVERDGRLVILLELEEAVPHAVWAGSDVVTDAAGAAEEGAGDA